MDSRTFAEILVTQIDVSSEIMNTAQSILDGGIESSLRYFEEVAQTVASSVTSSSAVLFNINKGLIKLGQIIIHFPTNFTAKIVERILEITSQYQNFEMANRSFRNYLISSYMKSSQKKKALYLLNSTPWDNAIYSSDIKIENYMEICLLSLELNEIAMTETALNGLQSLYSNLDKTSEYKYNEFRAHFLFQKRKYLDSGFKYLSLLTLSSYQALVAGEERVSLLERVLLSSILAPKCKRKLTLISCVQKLVGVELYPNMMLIVGQMAIDQIVPLDQLNDEVMAISKKHLMLGDFAEHKVMDILKSTINQHNVTVISNSYESVSLHSLAELLATPIDRARTLVLNLIQYGSLNGKFNITDEMLILDSNTSKNSELHPSNPSNKTTSVSDNAYVNICVDLLDTIHSVATDHPDWYLSVR